MTAGPEMYVEVASYYPLSPDTLEIWQASLLFSFVKVILIGRAILWILLTQRCLGLEEGADDAFCTGMIFTILLSHSGEVWPSAIIAEEEKKTVQCAACSQSVVFQIAFWSWIQVWWLSLLWHKWPTRCIVSAFFINSWDNLLLFLIICNW